MRDQLGRTTFPTASGVIWNRIGQGSRRRRRLCQILRALPSGERAQAAIRPPQRELDPFGRCSDEEALHTGIPRGEKEHGLPGSGPHIHRWNAALGIYLIEQILASHSLVEGTMELSDLGEIVRELMRQHPGEHFPDLLAEFGYGLRRAPQARRGIPGAHATSKKGGPAVLHRQGWQQLRLCGPNSDHLAQCQDHRCAPPSAGLRLLMLQAGFCPRGSSSSL